MTNPAAQAKPVLRINVNIDPDIAASFYAAVEAKRMTKRQAIEDALLDWMHKHGQI